MKDDGVVLAIMPCSRGLGYVVFENPFVAMDWGVKQVRLRQVRDALLKAQVLMHMLQPSVLVLEDVDDARCRRSKRVKVLIEKLMELAAEQGVAVGRCSRWEVRMMFGRMGAVTKDDIAERIAVVVPELAPRLPPRRRIWESEHHSMAIFEAAALALTHMRSDEAGGGSWSGAGGVES